MQHPSRNSGHGSKRPQPCVQSVQTVTPLQTFSSPSRTISPILSSLVRLFLLHLPLLAVAAFNFSIALCVAPILLGLGVSMAIVGAFVAVGLDTVSPGWWVAVKDWLGRKQHEARDRRQTRAGWHSPKIETVPTLSLPLSPLSATDKPGWDALVEDEEQRITAMTTQMHLKHQDKKHLTADICLTPNLSAYTDSDGNTSDNESERSMDDEAADLLEFLGKDTTISSHFSPKPKSMHKSASIRAARLSSLSGRSLSPAGPRLPRRLPTTTRSTRFMELTPIDEDDYDLAEDARHEHGMVFPA